MTKGDSPAPSNSTSLTVSPDLFTVAGRQPGGVGAILKGLAPSLLGVAGAFVAIYVVIQSAGPSYTDPGRVPFMLLLVISLPVILFLTLALHEGGHLLGAWLGRLEFRLVTVGPFRLAREVRGTRFSFVAHHSFQWQGNALCTPRLEQATTDSPGRLRLRLTVFLLGGPVATVVQTAVFLVLRHQLAGIRLPFWQVQILFLLVYCPLAILPFTLLPFNFRGVTTDAAQLWNLWRYPQRLRRRAALNWLTAASLSGVRPRDWPQAALDELWQTAGTGEETAVGRYLAYWQALDAGQPARAGQHLDEGLHLLADQPKAPGTAFLLAAASFTARFGADTAVAQLWLDLVQPEQYNALAVEIEQLAWLSKATVWQQAGRLAEARAAAQHSRALLIRTIDKGFAVLAGEWLDEILQATAHIQPVVLPPSRHRTVSTVARGVLLVAALAVLGLEVGWLWENGRALVGPANEWSGYQTGLVYFHNGRYRQAIHVLDQTLQQEPDFTQAYWLRGRAHYALGAYAAAIADFNQTIQQEQDDPNLWVYLYRADSYVQLGQFAQALTDYEFLQSSTDETLRQLAAQRLEDINHLPPQSTP